MCDTDNEMSDNLIDKGGNTTEGPSSIDDG